MNQTNLSSFIWSVADLLRGDYKQSDYGKAILPFTVPRRLGCVLEGTKDAVLKEKETRETAGLNPEPFLLKKSKQLFYNTSPLDMKKLMGDQDNIAENMYSYIQAFSPAVRDIFECFDFHTQVERLSKAGLLYLITEKFAGIDLHPETISNAQMRTVFEELIRKFAELSNETAGEGVTFLRSQNVYDEGLRLDDVVFITTLIDESMAVSRVIPNDILLNITGASIGRSCVVPRDFPSANVNQHVCVIRLNDPSQVPAVGWTFKSAPIKNQIDHAQNGAAREGLDFVQIGEMAVPLPLLLEQTAIAAFLDAETSKIDALIAEQRRLIELLKEKRQAVISHAVTKGLNPDAPMKASGIEWLGDVPGHWAVVPQKHLCALLKDGAHLPPARVDDGIPLLSVRNVVDGGGVFRDDDSMISEASYQELCRSFVPQAGDVRADSRFVGIRWQVPA